MPYYTKSTAHTLEALHATKDGLSSQEAKTRLAKYGRNAIKVAGEPLWRKLLEPFASVFVLVLFVAAGISLWHGAILDAAIIGVIIAASAIIYYVQRFSTERILRALQKRSAQVVSVQRDGKPSQVDASLLVPGDIITLSEGEKVPADARLLTVRSLRVDEAQLTGESEPISKQTKALKGSEEVYDQSNMLFQGSFVVAGQAIAVVTATGNTTEFGRLAALTSGASEQSPVQVKIDKLLSQIIAGVAGLAVVAMALSLYRGMDLSESLRFVIALAVSAVPESLPVAISVVLVLGMRRMAAKKALVRTMRAIETIGTITTIATDKTGTLTKNKLTVQEIWQSPQSPRPLAQLVTQATNRSGASLHDPLDTAMHDYAKAQGGAQPKYEPAASLPFDQTAAMSGNLWHDGTSYDLVIKGAPEHVLARCDLTEGEHEQALAKLHKLTSEGYRVIAIAERSLKKPIASFKELAKSDKLSFCGFIAVADILRPEAKRAIQAATRAGVTVRMITGDHFETAYHIGQKLGMVTHRSQVFDARKLHVLSDEELESIIGSVRVFSRVVPEQKYRLLTLLKKHDITAMTGDGVNDAPALTGAHVGVAMGSGTAIAKEAGDIILVDDNFSRIVEAMREGRTIFANIRRMLFYLLSTNTGEVLTLLGALVIGMPVPLLPVQILWVNLITDTSMVIPLGLEPGEKAIMTQPPHRPNAPILGKFMISRMILIALTVAVLTLILYVVYSNTYGHDYGQTIAFCSLVVMQWSNALAVRSDHESFLTRLRVVNGKLYAGLAISIALQLLVVFGPLGPLLHIAPVAIGDLVITSLIAFAVPLLLIELHKYIGRRRYQL